MIEKNRPITPSDAVMAELKREYGDRVHVRMPFKAVRVLHIQNGCCPDLPVLLTVNPDTDGKTNYSCQCACDCWCTSGFASAEDAIEDYKAMTATEMLREDKGK